VRTLLEFSTDQVGYFVTKVRLQLPSVQVLSAP